MTVHRSPARSAQPLRDSARSGVRRRWVAAAVLVPLLAGCATSFGAQTSQMYQPGPGITVHSSEVWVLDAFIVTDGRGNGTLVGGLLNQATRTDSLQSVRVVAPGGKPLSTTIVPGTVAVADQRLVQLGDTGAVRVGGDLQAGLNYDLTLTFRNAAPATLTIPALSRTADFDTVPVGPLPSPTTPSHANP